MVLSKFCASHGCQRPANTPRMPLLSIETALAERMSRFKAKHHLGRSGVPGMVGIIDCASWCWHFCTACQPQVAICDGRCRTPTSPLPHVALEAFWCACSPILVAYSLCFSAYAASRPKSERMPPQIPNRNPSDFP